ncbi:hypothetical protein CP8484711_1236A, partial [Chlamydia psittaci 84-8471/1]
MKRKFLVILLRYRLSKKI